MDPVPTTAPPPAEVKDELKILVTGANGDLVLKDRFGKDHVLPPLDIADMVEYEKKVQTSIMDRGSANLRLQDVMCLLYLSLRKEGLSYEQIRRKDYKLTEHDVYTMFDLRVVAQASQIFLDLLKISGIDLRPHLPAPKA